MELEKSSVLVWS